MSQSHKQTTDDPAKGSIVSRTHKQTRIRSRDDDDGEEQSPSAQSSTHVSPAMRIYRHALESIFAMLNLQDLSQIFAVSRSWSAAVRSMKPIAASIDRDEWSPATPPVSTLVDGPLLRHLVAIHISEDMRPATPLTSETLALLTQHAPNITSLECDLKLSPAVPLAWSVKLSSLQLQLSDETSAAQVNAVLSTLAVLPSLQRFLLSGPASVAGVDFSLLAAAPSLLDLAIHSPDGRHPVLSDDQLTQLRSSLGHLHRIDLEMMGSHELARLLKPPVTVRWRDIGRLYGYQQTGAMLAMLPTLTKLDVDIIEAVPHADFLSQLPRLTTLALNCTIPTAEYCPQSHALFMPAEGLLASLLPCTGLTELDLTCGFNSAQVAALLAKLTRVKKLKLWCELETLQCFASGPATQTLEDLHLEQWTFLPLSELAHLRSLQRLRSLGFDGLFRQLDKASLCPPSALFPRLTKFAPSSLSPEHKGPSFEWMQQRLTQ